MKLHVTLPDGSARDLEARTGRSVMETIRDSGVPIRADCGGALACATCHVVVDAAWMERAGPASQDETDLLEGSEYRAPGSRLSCQIKMTAALDGLVVALQPDALE
jgi:2Fe-2S ferredoxin